MNEELNDNKIFEFDNKNWGKEYRKTIILLMIILPIMWVLVQFFESKTISFQLITDKIMMSPSIYIFALMLMFFYMLSKKSIIKKISLEINPDSFKLRNDKISETIPFSKIKEIKVYKNNKGEPVLFMIKTGKINYHVFSLKEMDRLLEWFEQNKISSMNWNLSFHKKNLFEIKRYAFLGLWLSLIVFFRIYDFDLTLILVISCISLGLLSFIIQNIKISHLNDKVSTFRWIYFALGLLFILFAIF